MNFNQIIIKVEPERRDDFKNFVQTGEASEEFLTYLENNEDCSHAAELMLEGMVKSLRG